jgi:hypothetical protein
MRAYFFRISIHLPTDESAPLTRLAFTDVTPSMTGHEDTPFASSIQLQLFDRLQQPIKPLLSAPLQDPANLNWQWQRNQDVELIGGSKLMTFSSGSGSDVHPPPRSRQKLSHPRRGSSYRSSARVSSRSSKSQPLTSERLPSPAPSSTMGTDGFSIAPVILDQTDARFFRTIITQELFPTYDEIKLMVRDVTDALAFTYGMDFLESKYHQLQCDDTDLPRLRTSRRLSIPCKYLPRVILI